MKLKSKLVISNMLIVILTMSSLTISLLLISSYYSDKILDKTSKNISERFVVHATRQADQTLSYLSEALLNPMYFYDIETIYYLLAPALHNESVSSIAVFDSSGQIIHTGTENETDYGMPLDNPSVVESVIGNKQVFSEVIGSELTIARPLIMNKKLLGGVVMTYSLNAAQIDINENKAIIAAINDLSRKHSTILAAIVAITMCLVNLYLSALMAGTLSKPIAKLLIHAKRISKGEYQVFNTIQRNDELGELALAFNDMDASLKQRNDKIEFLAYNDPLTQLPNRSQFIKCLENKIEMSQVSGEAFSVLFIDLDGFKRVNDNLGHQAGDELLCEISSIIGNAIQRTPCFSSQSKLSSLTARVGGDEFILCIPGTSTQDSVARFASDIVKLLRQPIYLSQAGESVVIGASIGIAMYPGAGLTPEDLVKNADLAMYAVKSSGKSGYSHFTYEMKHQVLVKAKIEKELRLAISDFTQFKLYYQPKIDLTTGHITGAEALIRWKHPTKGDISPADFIPVAEATDIIYPLSEWIIGQACKDIKEWQAKGLHPDFHIALNLSPKQLYGNKVLKTVLQQLKNHQLDASRLHVEVTETALMGDKAGAKETLDSLRNIGIEVWLDDFGTGFSSLGYLREFSVDGLKIDRSFVSDIDHDIHDRSLCSAVISMAHQLGIKVVAEGIETTSQSSFLSNMKCDYGQGYLFAKPMPFNELTLRMSYCQMWSMEIMQ